MNARDREQSTRVIHRQYKDTQGNIHTEYKDSQGNIYTEYKDSQGNIHPYENGYADGQLAEERTQDARVDRADKNISKGVLIGVIVTCVLGLSAGTIYFLTQLNNPQSLTVMNVPANDSTQSPSPPPQQVRIVEQPVVTIVPVPQAQSTGSTVNITQPAASNSSTKPRSVSPAKPLSQNSGTSVPRSIVLYPP